MKAISVREPFAHLWAMGMKVNLMRGNRTRHRGWLLIHASTWFDFELLPPDLLAVLDKRFSGWQQSWKRGGLIGAVRIVRCEPAGIAKQFASPDELLYSAFVPGFWAWRAEQDPVIFAETIPFKGKLGMFDVPDELIAERAPWAWGVMNARAV